MDSSYTITLPDELYAFLDGRMNIGTSTLDITLHGPNQSSSGVPNPEEDMIDKLEIKHQDNTCILQITEHKDTMNSYTFTGVLFMYSNIHMYES